MTQYRRIVENAFSTLQSDASFCGAAMEEFIEPMHDSMAIEEAIKSDEPGKG